MLVLIACQSKSQAPSLCLTPLDVILTWTYSKGLSANSGLIRCNHISSQSRYIKHYFCWSGIFFLSLSPIPHSLSPSLPIWTWDIAPLLYSHFPFQTSLQASYTECSVGASTQWEFSIRQGFLWVNRRLVEAQKTFIFPVIVSPVWSEVCIFSSKEALHDQEGCESGVIVHGFIVMLFLLLPKAGYYWGEEMGSE